jgi:hypothetical protein
VPPILAMTKCAAGCQCCCVAVAGIVSTFESTALAALTAITAIAAQHRK